MKSTTEIKPDDFLLTILIEKYAPSDLESLLDYLFSQQDIPRFEIILNDNGTDAANWKIGNLYASRYPGQITLTRNTTEFGHRQDLIQQLQMARGKYYVRLSHTLELDTARILESIAQLEADPLITHSFIGRVSERFIPRQKQIFTQSFERHGKPLVSICIYNYNYGCFLAQCLESVAAQTYENIEICFSDNASSDESWKIAQEFADRYPRRMSLIRNRENFGAGANLTNCRRNALGKYLLLLCSDDAITPDYVERCVTLLEKHPDAAFAIVHREIMDEAGSLVSEPPFYDQTCLIDGEEQAAVYMMAAVTPSISQVFYNHEKMMTYSLPHNFSVRWFGQRLMDFFLCLESPVIYIKDPLLLNRVHGGSDGAAIDANLVQGVGQYILALLFAETATQYGMKKPGTRLDAAIEKVGRLCLRYCTNFLRQGDKTASLRYFHLAQALFPGVVSDANFVSLKQYWDAAPDDDALRGKILADLAARAELTPRRVSYAPPPGSIPC